MFSAFKNTDPFLYGNIQGSFHSTTSVQFMPPLFYRLALLSASDRRILTVVPAMILTAQRPPGCCDDCPSQQRQLHAEQ